MNVDPTNARPRLCFVSYRHLSQLALPVLHAFRDRADIEIIDEVFGPALELAKARERVGSVDAFVSAGANAMTLRGALKTPVATIRVGGYDILTALLKARTLADRAGVVTYRETIPELESVKALLSIEIDQRSYSSSVEAEMCFRAMAAEGCKVIVGSSIVVELAQRHGLVGILAYSEASVARGIETAIELARVARLEIARTEQLNGVLDNLQEAVLAVDSSHRVIAANPPMAQLLGRTRHSMLGVDLDALEPSLSLSETLRSGLTQRGGVLQLARRDWIVHRTAIHDRGVRHGAVITLYDARSIADADTTLRTKRRSREAPTARYSFRDLSGVSPAFLRARDAALRFSGTDLTVLITGESGTGKELFAQAIHRAGPRAEKPFIALNCSAFPETLLESELFGYDEGAFTGARKGGRRGMFEAAHTGTLFLDEIGDMPVSLQTRLLRVLQEREVVRLGGHSPISVDVRVIAATHQDLPALIAERRFRSDLYYRLNILRLRPPPLRERRADILTLAGDLLARALHRLGSAIEPQAVLAMLGARLLAYEWPGNVRELENLCERIAVFAAQHRGLDQLVEEELAHDCPELFGSSDAPSSGGAEDGTTQSPFERDAERLRLALHASGGNRQEAARRLGVSRATLWRRMKAFQLLDRPDMRESS